MNMTEDKQWELLDKLARIYGRIYTRTGKRISCFQFDNVIVDVARSFVELHDWKTAADKYQSDIYDPEDKNVSIENEYKMVKKHLGMLESCLEDGHHDVALHTIMGEYLELRGLF